MLKNKKSQLNNQPLVSVIIPFFNRFNWLNIAINSVLNQTYKNFEIILIDDGSTENIRKFINLKNPKIKYYHQKKNLGPAKARNLGIRFAKGKYLAFLDSDDLFLKNKLELQVKIMEQHPKTILSHTAYSYIKESGVVNLTPRFINYYHHPYPRIVYRCLIATPTVMINKNLLKNLRFEEKLKIGEDVVLWSRIAKISPIISIDKVLTKVRNHSQHTAKIPIKEKLKALANIINSLYTYEQNKFIKIIFILSKSILQGLSYIS